MKPSCDDVMVWPDGTWCYRDDGADMRHHSDDYYVIPADTPEWERFINHIQERESAPQLR